MLSVQFTEIPTQLLGAACKKYKGSGNTLSVYLTISQNILQFPEGRQSLIKELSLRYIGKQLNMKFQNVWKALKKLVKDGFIKILKTGDKEEGTGSILQLVINSITPPCNKNDYKDKNCKYKNNNKHGVVSSKNTSEENKNQDPEKSTKEITPPLTVLPEEPILNLPPAPAGVMQHTIKNSVKILRERGITDLTAAIKKITQEMAGRTIKNINGYFTTLCKTFDFSGSGSSSPIPSALASSSSGPLAPGPQGSNTAAIAKKAQIENDRKFQEEEETIKQEKPLPEVWEELKKKSPDVAINIMKQIDRQYHKLPGMFRIPLYMAAFRENYPDLYGSG